jgi:amino-acid N-acetyltransferase
VAKRVEQWRWLQVFDGYRCSTGTILAPGRGTKAFGSTFGLYSARSTPTFEPSVPTPLNAVSTPLSATHTVSSDNPGAGPVGRLARMEVIVRRARTADVRGIRRLIDRYSQPRLMLSKATVALYEDVHEFWVAARTSDGAIVGCGALHVMWEDLAEVRTVAVDPDCQGQKIGRRIVAELLGAARELGVRRLFVLTFETGFFRTFGFEVINGAPVTHEVYEELLRSYDEGVAEFLDLERVKPNTLGNTRMLLHL